jgi:hypothetical protein
VRGGGGGERGPGACTLVGSGAAAGRQDGSGSRACPTFRAVGVAVPCVSPWCSPVQLPGNAGGGGATGVPGRAAVGLPGCRPVVGGQPHQQQPTWGHPRVGARALVHVGSCGCVGGCVWMGCGLVAPAAAAACAFFGARRGPTHTPAVRREGQWAQSCPVATMLCSVVVCCRGGGLPIPKHVCVKGMQLHCRRTAAALGTGTRPQQQQQAAQVVQGAGPQQRGVQPPPPPPVGRLGTPATRTRCAWSIRTAHKHTRTTPARHVTLVHSAHEYEPFR